MNSINRSMTYPSIAVALAIGCFVVLPNAPAVNPPPDGGYPGGNTAEGQQALFDLSTGTFNTAIGWLSLATVATGELNTAVGAAALLVNTANGNTAIGTGALLNNTIGFGNTANGTFALVNNITGTNNTAVGREALSSLTNGNSNTAIGRDALLNNNIGSNNVAVGRDALLSSTSGESNVAVGRGALANSTISDSNLALGIDAGNQIVTASNVICIGHTGADVSDTTWIGNVFGVTTQSGTTAPVIVSNNGQLGTVASSERFKKDIVSMQKTSDAILALRPVTFHYKTDTGNTPQFGLIAEEVAKVNPSLVLADKDGKAYTVRYDAINAMLLNEFLKEHKTVQEQGAMIMRQQKAIEALTSGLQKVSAQLELNKAASQTALNDN